MDDASKVDVAVWWNRRKKPVDLMRVVRVKPVGHNIYEITTESKQYGTVTQRVLVFPRD